ncbi:MAG: PAS domain S-box protein [Verrucomicrobia bacterium]|nr:PAS domain S-box protein [Verrucomicrobiota bacterium]
MFLDEAPDAMMATTLGGKIILWNRGAETLFGCSSAEAVGRQLSEVTVPPDRAGEEERLRLETQSKGLITYETIRRRQDGSLVYVSVSSKLVAAPDGLTHHGVRGLVQKHLAQFSGHPVLRLLLVPGVSHRAKQAAGC